MQEFMVDLPTPKHTVWDNYVPITSQGSEHFIYLNDIIEGTATYNELCYRLRTAKEYDTYNLFICTPGGILDAALTIVNELKKTKAKTIAHISGTVASAGTIITLACKEIVVAPHTAFMIHNYSGGLYGKGHELKAHQEFVDANLNNSFKAFYDGFLTLEEIDDVISGKDYWMNKEEVEGRLNGSYFENGNSRVRPKKVKLTSGTATPAKRGRKPKAV